MSWRTSRLEAVERRLAETEHDYRAELAYLTHALKECVSAISAVSQVVNWMCISASDASSEWENAAAALHNAAIVGMRALDGAAGKRLGNGGGCSKLDASN